MAGVIVVIGVPFLIFFLGYATGVSGSNSLAHQYIAHKGLTRDFDDWVARVGGVK